jgi:hypothetical protein
MNRRTTFITRCASKTAFASASFVASTGILRNRLNFLTRVGCMLAVLNCSAAMFAQPLPVGMITVSAGGVGDDTDRLQYAINTAQSGVFFKAGMYTLTRPLRLRSGLTYAGEGGFWTPYGSVLKQVGTPNPVAPGNAIFSVEGTVSNVTIIRLTFYADPALKARGIAAADSTSLLRNSTLRDNYFLTDLAECIDTPMVATRIERNEFGQNGGSFGPRHRHIHSVNPGLVPYPSDNWVVGNVFRWACCETAPGPGQSTESVYFESSVPLHITGNNFETNDTDTALRIHGTSQVFIEGNWFEGNHGLAQMTFRGPATYVARLENNWYSLYGWQKKPDGKYARIDCDPKAGLGNCYIFRTEPGQGGGGLPLVYMGYEVGQNFTSTTEITANPSFLAVTGPLCFRTYRGTQAGLHLLDCR